MSIERAACAQIVLFAALAAGCGRSSPVAETTDPPSPSSGSTRAERTGTLSVAAFRFSGWHDERFHYMPALSVAAPSGSRPVFVQRVDFTAEDAGTRRLLKGVRYARAQQVQPGGTVDLVTDPESAGLAEIGSEAPLGSITAIVFFTDDEGRTGIVTAAAEVPVVPDRAAVASLAVRDFTVGRRQHQGRFLYRPTLTLAETSGHSDASIKKIMFELLGVGGSREVTSVWKAPNVPAGGTVRLLTGKNGPDPWFEIDSTADAPRLSVVISFVDAEGRGGLVSAIASVAR